MFILFPSYPFPLVSPCIERGPVLGLLPSVHSPGMNGEYTPAEVGRLEG